VLHKTGQSGNVEAIGLLLQGGAKIQSEGRMWSRLVLVTAWNGNDKGAALVPGTLRALGVNNHQGRPVHACAT